MIIYLYGSDSYRRLRKQKEIIAAYKEKHSSLTLDRFFFDLPNGGEEWGKFENFVKAGSLFGGTKLAVISGLFGLGDSVKAGKFIAELVDREEMIILLSEEKALSKGFEFLKKSRKVLSQEFDELNREQFKKFILQEAGARGLQLAPEAIVFLNQIYEGDSWGALMELEKMALSSNLQFAIYNLQTIFNEPIFNLIFKIKTGQLKDRLRSLELLLASEDAAKVFNLAVYSANAEKKRIFADLDCAVKSGKLDYEAALLSYVMH